MTCLHAGAPASRRLTQKHVLASPDLRYGRLPHKLLSCFEKLQSDCWTWQQLLSASSLGQQIRHSTLPFTLRTRTVTFRSRNSTFLFNSQFLFWDKMQVSSSFIIHLVQGSNLWYIALLPQPSSSLCPTSSLYSRGLLVTVFINT